MRYYISMLLSLKILQGKNQVSTSKNPWLPIGRRGVNFIVHLITWLKILRFKILFPTAVGILDIVSWPKSKPKSEFLHTNMPLLLQLNIFLDGLPWNYYVVLLLLSDRQAGDVTEYLSNIVSDILPVLQSFCQGTLLGADWWPEGLLSPPGR